MNLAESLILCFDESHLLHWLESLIGINSHVSAIADDLSDDLT